MDRAQHERLSRVWRKLYDVRDMLDLGWTEAAQALLKEQQQVLEHLLIECHPVESPPVQEGG